eukprot:CAMPEP_0185252442 /NCGR_PEP_ID=MMETSP1359-20130426/1526_1 /TAXON_ID=552665 /ORGANISM="Bigelowiella longifila, Strain CCMP242" /LENGTH=219 /DNA_ID=CAMNT_0027834603 /DNA_START=178 /DNA_END=837 /DNA_ORIENTATION=+
MSQASTPAKRALLIVDVQNDFCPPSGSLMVKDGADVIPHINKLKKECKWDLICASQDWHPSDHCSFASNNKGAKLFTEITMESGSKQMMWPVHCVQGSEGAKFHNDLDLNSIDKIVKKGTHQHVDSYSAFFDNDKKTKTELNEILEKHGITDLYITGLAYDFCVGFSALDAKNIGYNTTVITDATRSVAEESAKSMKKQLEEAKITQIGTKDVIAELSK